MKPGAQIFPRWLVLLLVLLLAGGCSFDASGLTAPTLDNRPHSPVDSAPADGTTRADAPLDGPTAEAAPPCQTWNPAWTKRSKLTFDNTALGATSSDVLIDFPVLITLTPQRRQALSLRQDGADLRFIDADGKTVLPYEVETQAPTGAWQIWVRVPQIDKASTTDHIWLHHGNPNAAPSSLPAATVWSKGFSGVWHLNQDPTATAPQFPDSTGHANAASAMGALGKGNQVAGQIGGAILFPGKKSCYLEAADSASLAPATSLTLESWVRPQVIDTDFSRHPMHKGVSYFLQLTRDFTTRPALYIHLKGYGWYTVSVPPLKANSWAYLAGTYDTTERVMRIFLDGQLSASRDLAKHRNKPVTTTPTISASTSPLHIGTAIEGEVDEVRLSAVKRSDGWIAAQHRSMTDAFVTYGLPEATCP